MRIIDARIRQVTVETDDGDTQVFADAEGTGSQGRSHEQGLLDKPDDDETGDTAGKPADQDEPPHLDIEA